MIRNNYIYIYIYARNTWIAEPRKAPGGGVGEGHKGWEDRREMK